MVGGGGWKIYAKKYHHPKQTDNNTYKLRRKSCKHGESPPAPPPKKKKINKFLLHSHMGVNKKTAVWTFVAGLEKQMSLFSAFVFTLHEIWRIRCRGCQDRMTKCKLVSTLFANMSPLNRQPVISSVRLCTSSWRTHDETENFPFLCKKNSENYWNVTGRPRFGHASIMYRIGVTQYTRSYSHAKLRFNDEWLTQ